MTDTGRLLCSAAAMLRSTDAQQLYGDPSFNTAGLRVWTSLPPHLRQDMNFQRWWWWGWKSGGGEWGETDSCGDEMTLTGRKMECVHVCQSTYTVSGAMIRRSLAWQIQAAISHGRFKWRALSDRGSRLLNPTSPYLRRYRTVVSVNSYTHSFIHQVTADIKIEENRNT